MTPFCTIPVPLASIVAQTAPPVPWRYLESRALAELRPADFQAKPPADWAVLQGRAKLVNDASQPERAGVIEADGVLRLWAGDAAWRRYAVTAEVRTRPGRYVCLAAACDREGGQVRPGYEIGVAALPAKPFSLATRTQDPNGPLPRPSVNVMGERREMAERGSWLKPDFNPWAARLKPRDPDAAQRRVEGWEREFENTPDHQHRWLRLRVEVTPQQARLWLDSILMASVDRSKYSRGGVSLLLMSGSQVRSARAETIPEQVDGRLLLDLTALCNGRGVGGDLGDGFALRPESLPTPGTFVEISGIPFLCTAKADGPNTLDVSKTAYRGGRGTAAGEQRLDAATCRAPWRQPAPAPLRRAPARQPHRGPAGASRLGAWVCGNGAAWVDLELEDAEGNRWTTVRPPLLYDFGVQYRGPHAFDGWRYVAYPLTAPAEKKDWPDHFRCGDRTGPPALPARLTAVVVQQYAEILHINRLVPPSPETWRIGEILAD